MTSTTAKLLEIVALHNGEGLSLYENGSLKEAQQVIVKVLQSLRTLSVEEEQRGDDEAEGSSSQAVDDDTAETYPRPMQLDCKRYCSSNEGQQLDAHYYRSLPTDLYFVRCRSTYEITAASSSSSSETTDSVFTGAMRIANDIPLDIESVTAVALYNLAVVNHVIGIASSSSSVMARALKLYEQALIVAEDCCCYFESSSETAPSDCVALTLLTAAIYNNAAHINSTVFYNFGTARAMMEQLNDIVVMMLQEYEPYNTDTGSLIIPLDDFNFFLSSLNFAKIIQYDRFAPAA